MARLESEAKGGFYPTPPEEMAHILKLVSVAPGQAITLLDPCAGEGAALAQMADYIRKQGATATSYGIELEKSRAIQADQVIDHVLAAGYEETRLSHEAFSLLYLNPPFAEVRGNRLEKMFLEDLSDDYLPQGGLLIFNIPQYVLRYVAGILANRFVDLKVFRFTDENGNYDRFKQVIVFGKKRRKGLRTGEERLEKDRVEKELHNLSWLGKDAITPLDQLQYLGVSYEIEQAPKPVLMFQSMKVDPEDVLISQIECGHYQKVMQRMSSLEITSSGRNIRPALPLKTTHVATAIASGVLAETMGSHMLVGVTKRIQEERTAFNPRTGKEQEITTFKPKSIVRIFSDKGIYNLK